MAYSAANVAAADLTLAAADKPMLGALVVYAPTAVEWSEGGSFAGADVTASGYPGSRAYDGLVSVETKPASTDTDYFYLLDLSGDPITFDGAMILGHNFGTAGVTAATLQIADDSAFSTNLVSVATWSSPGTGRLVDLALGSGTAQRYTDVSYVRLYIQSSPAATPQFTELALFKRTQLQWRPNRPYDETLTAQRSNQTRTDAGETTAYVSSRGARRVLATVPVTSAAKITEVKTWWTDTRHGTRSFVWVEYPSSAPSTTTYLVSIDGDPELEFNETGPNFRELMIDAVEQGPHFQALE